MSTDAWLAIANRSRSSECSPCSSPNGRSSTPASMQPTSTPTGARRRRRLRALAALVLAAGVTRVVWGAKPADFYPENPVFWFTMAAFAAVGILSIRPTTRYLRWRKALDGDAGALPAAAEISSARPAIHHQLAAFTTIPALAALMARGIGL
jgi:putative membrane protein